MSFRVASWNTRFGQADDALIAGRGLDVLCLQEADRATVERFGRHFDWAVHAHDPELLDGIEPCARHAPAVLGRAPLVGVPRPPMRHLVAPDKLVVADVSVAGTPSFLAVASYHAHNGKKGDDGCDKARLTMQVGEWLEGEWGPVIVGDGRQLAVGGPSRPGPDRVLLRVVGASPFRAASVGSGGHPRAR